MWFQHFQIFHGKMQALLFENESLGKQHRLGLAPLKAGHSSLSTRPQCFVVKESGVMTKPKFGKSSWGVHRICWTRLCCQNTSPRILSDQLGNGINSRSARGKVLLVGEWKYWAIGSTRCLTGSVTLGKNMRNSLQFESCGSPEHFQSQVQRLKQELRSLGLKAHLPPSGEK